MQPIHTPSISAKYWLAILMASVFGTNLGDLYAHESGLSLLSGLAVLTALVTGLFALERHSSAPTAVFYWLVIALIRTGATNIADFLSFSAHLPAVPLHLWMLGWSGVFALVIAVAGGATIWLDRSTGSQRLSTGTAYWVAMLGAGIFGTILGDVASRALGGTRAAALLLVLFGMALGLRRRLPLSVAVFWLTIAVARTAGTAIGDCLAEDSRLNLGLPLATLISGLIFAAATAGVARSRVRAEPS